MIATKQTDSCDNKLAEKVRRPSKTMRKAIEIENFGPEMTRVRSCYSPIDLGDEDELLLDTSVCERQATMKQGISNASQKSPSNPLRLVTT